MNGLIIVVWQLVNLRFRPSGTTTIGSTTSIRPDLLASAVFQLDGYDRFTSRNATFFRVHDGHTAVVSCMTIILRLRLMHTFITIPLHYVQRTFNRRGQ
jgi:hypothetical protein